jgi:hypothetical protein
VTLQPTFTIQTISVDGKDWTLFVDIGAPAMTGQSVENALGDQVVVFLPSGTPALIPEADTPPAPAPAPTPPGAVVPAPAPSAPSSPPAPTAPTPAAAAPTTPPRGATP